MSEMTLAEATKIVVDTAWACTVDEPAKYFKEEDYERDMAAIEIVKASLGIPGGTGVSVSDLQVRVEELEEENESIRAKIVFLRDGCHHSTYEQIDAAWEIINNFNGAYSTIGRWVLRVLERLGIFRCKSPGCNHGTYTEGNDDGSETHTRPCEVCHGHAWVIKEPS